MFEIVGLIVSVEKKPFSQDPLPAQFSFHLRQHHLFPQKSFTQPGRALPAISFLN
jgi:hypothetical protein